MFSCWGRFSLWRALLWITLVFPLVATVGCDSDTPDAANNGTGKRRVLNAGGLSENTLCALKNDKPQIVMNVGSEVAKLQSLDVASQEETILRQALLAVVERGLKHKQYQGKNTFVVRMVLLTALDEYHRPNWADSIELAQLELERTAIQNLSATDIGQLSRTQLASLFTNRQLSLNILATVEVGEG